MRARSPKGWVLTLGLAALAILGALAARSAPETRRGEDIGAEADSCVRYGRIECCIKDPQ